MYVPVGHSEVRAETVSKLSGQPACSAETRAREREREQLSEHICELY